MEIISHAPHEGLDYVISSFFVGELGDTAVEGNERGR